MVASYISVSGFDARIALHDMQFVAMVVPGGV